MQKSASIDLGPYQLVERIGEGGTGQVYRARGPAGPVAIKVLGPAADMDDAARARFGREIAALGELAHPHLVAMLDHGIDPELGLYLVLPLLAGTTIRVLAGGRALCPEAALLLAQPIAHATAALHAAGYAHRDLKPENVIAGPDGAITVIDLGLAWREGMTRHTETGMAVGSIGYMAPEQIEGRTVDPRADVWAIGVMIYEWIAGARPFARGRAAEEAAAMLIGACPRLTAADRRAGDDLADLVARCLAVDPARRPAAAALAAAIDAMIDWTDASAAERAALVGDPAGYQARVAAFRTRRIASTARQALAAHQAFAALALCDRGLAYASDDATLLALVAEAEAATARRPDDPALAATAPMPAVARPPRRSPRWPWLAGIAVIAVIAVALAVSRDEPQPEQPPPIAAADPDRKLLGDAISLFGRALAARDGAPSPSAGQSPTTAAGWLELAAAQPPADAVISVRRALALSPTWLDAQIALCAALAAANDPGALAACDVAIRRRPDEIALFAARGAARLQSGDARAALIDLDRVVAADPDPKWRRLRARARSAAGDAAGARKDLAHACELGDAAACGAH